MTENAKTFTFVGIAAALVGLAWIASPRRNFSPPADDAVNQRLFPEFNEPSTARDLEIVRWDQDAAKVQRFRVRRSEGRWTIPSKSGYPADAENAMAEVAAGLVNLKISQLAGTAKDQHREFGVIDPGADDFRPGTAGAGTRVTVCGESGRKLADLVIGKELVRDDSERFSRPDADLTPLHFVRKVDQDAVYVVAVDTSKLSTRFEDWIEKDLLKLREKQVPGKKELGAASGYIAPPEVKEVRIHDYTIELNKKPPINDRGHLTLGYADGQWKLLDEEHPDGGKFVSVKMREDEELDTSKLSDLRFALTDLRIVDVVAKPAGLSAELKAPKNGLQDEDVMSLEKRGFYLVPVGEQVTLVSNQGEIFCQMNNGVEYVLRFGETASTPGAEKPESAKQPKGPGAKQAKDDKADAGQNRYLLIMAQFNPDGLRKPDLKPLPEEKPAEPEKAKDAAKPEAGKGGEKAGPAAKPEVKKPEVKPVPARDIKQQREEVQRHNKQEQERFDRESQEAQARVRILNQRFADWYYVISNDTYKKIHLSRADFIKKKEKKDEKGKAAATPEPGHEGHEHADHEHADDEHADHDHADHDHAAESAPAAKPKPDAAPAKPAPVKVAPPAPAKK